MRSILFSNKKHRLSDVYAENTIKALALEANLDNALYDAEDVRNAPTAFSDVTCIFSTWGMPSLTETEISEYFPNLQCIFYSAGSVQDFARPFLHRGIRVFSAWAANGIPVAEYTVAQIILANKGFFTTAWPNSVGDLEAAKAQKKEIRGNFGAKIGIIGAGMIGKLVIQMLKNYRLEVVVFDPFLPEETAKELGVEKVSLEEIFSTCHVVSNHLANNAQTQGMMTKAHFASMLPNATFINTGRGAQIMEEEMLDVLEKRQDLTAILDVTYPTKPAETSRLYALPNVILTPHIAGSLGDEFHRMSEYMLEEFRLWKKGEETRWEVTEKMLETMA